MLVILILTAMFLPVGCMYFIADATMNYMMKRQGRLETTKNNR